MFYRFRIRAAAAYTVHYKPPTPASPNPPSRGRYLLEAYSIHTREAIHLLFVTAASIVKRRCAGGTLHPLFLQFTPKTLSAFWNIIWINGNNRLSRMTKRLEWKIQRVMCLIFVWMAFITTLWIGIIFHASLFPTVDEFTVISCLKK